MRRGSVAGGPANTSPTSATNLATAASTAASSPRRTPAISARDENTSAAKAGQRRAELANRREHDALARIFGEAAAAAYLELLFGR